MTLNPFAVFLAIAFWIWLWGPIGGFIAVPLLLVVVSVLEIINNTAQSEEPGRSEPEPEAGASH
jgi:predicted PurR-regulated permease PerM